MLNLLTICMAAKICYGESDVGCQDKSTIGRDYNGTANTTRTGIPCQKWSDTQPHNHEFTMVGEHSFCRNPENSGVTKLWCYTSNSSVQWQYCSVPFCPTDPVATDLKDKVLDFSLDGDWKTDTEGFYTHASLHLKENLPSSFTVCAAFMVDYWWYAANSPLFLLRDNDMKNWLYLDFFGGSDGDMEFYLEVSGVRSTVKSQSFYYTWQWMRFCFSFNSSTSLATLVVDGEQLMEENVALDNPPANLSMILGWSGKNTESPGMITDLNIFSKPLLNLKEMTEAGGNMCGALGDYLNWEKTDWSLHSNARVVPLKDIVTRPCKKKSKVQVFHMKGKHWQSHCMQHCQKLGGRSPSVKTLEEWHIVHKEIEHIRNDHKHLPSRLWLSATEGDKKNMLSRLDQWPEGRNAVESVWRDFYTGDQLDNYTKPWYSTNADNEYGENSNCILYRFGVWQEWDCFNTDRGCPCSFENKPILHLRGFCPDTKIKHNIYTTLTIPTSPSGEISFVGKRRSQIKHDPSLGKWILEGKFSSAKAESKASQHSYALGKHNWTISKDSDKCSNGQSSYTIAMKLTGCKEDEFTCDDGQCIAMEERCDQLPNCRDKSDEIGCKILFLENGYNKRVPPITSAGNKPSLESVPVGISMTLMKVVAMEEEEHSIELQFQMSLEWKENRATYHNLKNESHLNALSKVVEVKNLLS